MPPWVNMSGNSQDPPKSYSTGADTSSARSATITDHDIELANDEIAREFGMDEFSNVDPMHSLPSPSSTPSPPPVPSSSSPPPPPPHPFQQPPVTAPGPVEPKLTVNALDSESASECMSAANVQDLSPSHISIESEYEHRTYGTRWELNTSVWFDGKDALQTASLALSRIRTAFASLSSSQVPVTLCTPWLVKLGAYGVFDMISVHVAVTPKTDLSLQQMTQLQQLLPHGIELHHVQQQSVACVPLPADTALRIIQQPAQHISKHIPSSLSANYPSPTCTMIAMFSPLHSTEQRRDELWIRHQTTTATVTTKQ
jgi:hypothetical protein